MLQKWINGVTEKEVKALRESKTTKMNLAQLQVSYGFIQKENRVLQKKVQRLKSLKSKIQKENNKNGHGKSKSIVYTGSHDLTENDKTSCKSGGGKYKSGSSRSLSAKKKRNGKQTSSNGDIFTLFPKSEGLYNDVVAGPNE